MRGIISIPIILALVIYAPYLSMASSYGIGTSSISVSANSISLFQGHSATVNYTISLISGSTWGTTISANNSALLSKQGITLTFNPSYGDPTYTGNLKISASNNTAPGTYHIALYATGDDPTTTNTTLLLNIVSAPIQKNTTIHNTTTKVTTTIPSNVLSNLSNSKGPIPIFHLIAQKSIQVNSTKGANISLGSALRVVIKPGTYVFVSNSLLSTYNFSLIDFSASKSYVPSNASNYIAIGAYAFAVNGVISPNIQFVNQSKDPSPIISYVMANNSTTSWTLLGGVFNGSAYINGTYKFPNVWSHPNNTVMVNTQFSRPVMWVFLSKISQIIIAPTTSVSASTTTINTVSNGYSVSNATNTTNTTTPSAQFGSWALYVLVILIILIAFLLKKFIKKV